MLLLACMEAARIAHTSYLYFRMRHYKSIIHFLMDVTQSSFLLVFMITALLLAIGQPATRDREMISMWVIFMSCIFEYAFMLIYIVKLLVSEAVFYFKTRPIKELVPKEESSVFDFVQYYYVGQVGTPVVKGMTSTATIEMGSTSTGRGLVSKQRLPGQRAPRKMFGKEGQIIGSRVFRRQPRELGTENR